MFIDNLCREAEYNPVILQTFLSPNVYLSKIRPNLTLKKGKKIDFASIVLIVSGLKLLYNACILLTCIYGV